MYCLAGITFCRSVFEKYLTSLALSNILIGQFNFSSSSFTIKKGVSIKIRQVELQCKNLIFIISLSWIWCTVANYKLSVMEVWLPIVCFVWFKFERKRFGPILESKIRISFQQNTKGVIQVNLVRAGDMLTNYL